MSCSPFFLTKIKKEDAMAKKKHTVQYDRWGYFFIAPFFIVYVIFSLIPYPSAILSGTV